MHDTNEKRPLVSIPIGTYNGDRYLEKQLDSLVAQDYHPLEIIIADDCSSDSTWSIIQRYANQYPHIKAHRNPTNLGMIKNYDAIFRRCSGELIAFCDQDDVWFPDKVSTQVREIGTASLTYSRLSYIDKNDQPLPDPPRKTNRLSGRCPLALVFHNCAAGNVTLIRREVFNYALPIPDAARAPDHWFPIIAAAMNGLHASDSRLSLYRVHESNISRKKQDRPHKGIRERIQERRKLFKTKLGNRLAVLEQMKRLDSLLSAKEKQLLNQLAAELGRLEGCFVNFRLKRLLIQHADLFLAVYKKPRKMANRLARGKYFFEATLYLRKP